MDLEPLRYRSWKVGQTVRGHARVTTAVSGIQKNGKPCLKLTLTDGDGLHVSAVKFDCPDEPPSVGVVLEIDGTVDDYHGPLSLKVATWRVAMAVSPEQFMPRMPPERRASMDELDALVAGIADEPLRALVEAAFDHDLRARFAVHPAAKTNHGAAVGGLLTHTVRVAQIALALAAFVPAIDRDLLLTAALLHDIGKLEELEEEPGSDFTERGKLLGHVTLGMFKVRGVAATIPDLAAERKDLLMHVIQAAHGKREYGAPVAPSTFEALLLHLADDAESRIEIALEAAEWAPVGARWTPYVQKLGTRFLVPEPLTANERRTADFEEWPDDDEVPF